MCHRAQCPWSHIVELSNFIVVSAGAKVYRESISRTATHQKSQMRINPQMKIVLFIFFALLQFSNIFVRHFERLYV